MQGRLLAVAAIILFLVAGVPVVQQGLWDASTASETQATFNDSFQPAEGDLSGLDSSNKSGVVYAPESDITVEQNDTEIKQPGNWTWIRHNGTIEVQSMSFFNSSETAHVNGYYTVPSTAQNATTEFGLFPTRDIGSEWLLMALVMLTLAALAVATRAG